MKVVNRLLFVIAIGSFASCAKLPVAVMNEGDEGLSINAYISVSGFKEGTKTFIIPKDGKYCWDVGDIIGIFSNKIEGPTNTPTQLALTLTKQDGCSTAAFSTSVGWQLDDGGDYDYFAYYPYSSENTRNSISINYRNQEQLVNGNTSGIGPYDYIYSDASLPDSPSSATFSCHHIGAALNLKIPIPEKYSSMTFKRMRIVAENQIFTTSAKYDIPSIAQNGSPSFFAEEKSCYMDLSFGDDGFSAVDDTLDVWMMLFPAELEGETLSVKLYADHTPVCTLEGQISILSDLEAGNIYRYSLESIIETGRHLPDKPLDDEALHVLLFGHSFGEDCTQYLPAICVAAGIQSLHLVRLYESGCPLSRHWWYCTTGNSYGTYGYQESKPGTDYITVYGGKKVLDILEEAPWDIILFQHGIGFGYAGDYDTYQPYLDSLIDYTTRMCYQMHGKKPVVVWNMFWGYNTDKSTSSDVDATAMYNAVVAATKEMKDDTGLDLIVAPGTAMENARKIYKVSEGYRMLTRDGYHASSGMGRYLAACTWFQYLMKPIYGIDIEGNTYRPTQSSFDKDVVDDDVALVLQKCANEAINHPFEVTEIK